MNKWLASWLNELLSHMLRAVILILLAASNSASQPWPRKDVTDIIYLINILRLQYMTAFDNIDASWYDGPWEKRK